MSSEILLRIPADHPALPGHFPGNPIVPGVVLLAEALRAIEAASGISLEKCQIGSVKFQKTVAPGEQLAMEFTVDRAGDIAFALRSANKIAVQGVVTPRTVAAI
jgi:3-hydroxymyristoyl/3-hydroxydecanoyl-(acyl carrier protein) dehydratase